MHVLGSAAAAALLVAAAGCTGGIETFNPGGADAGADGAAQARAMFDSDITPLLNGFCAACHSTPGSIGFVAPDPDVYTAVMAWPGLVNLESPASSRLLAKGSHDGPAWTAAQQASVEAWIGLEADARAVEPAAISQTAAFAPVVGINTIDLAQIGLPGSTVTFRLERLQVGIYLSELMVNAGPAGAHLTHPLLVTWSDGLPTPDPIDRFADVELSLQPATSAMIGGGTVVLVNVPVEAMLSLHFSLAEPAAGGEVPTAAGCKDVASFTTNAQPALAANCASCHAGADASATAATDMSRLGDLAPEAQAAACGQILSRVNLADPPNSGLFVAPDPLSGAGHPFKFGGDPAAFTAFRDQVLVWINTEVAAP